LTGAQAAQRFEGENARLGDRDTRTARVVPSAQQRRLAQPAGVRATWNRFGTARTLSVTRGSIARGLSADPVAAARWTTTR
jgi:hypothetical protein